MKKLETERDIKLNMQALSALKFDNATGQKQFIFYNTSLILLLLMFPLSTDNLKYSISM